jgi:hypothetical protein
MLYEDFLAVCVAHPGRSSLIFYCIEKYFVFSHFWHYKCVFV